MYEVEIRQAGVWRARQRENKKSYVEQVHVQFHSMFCCWKEYASFSASAAAEVSRLDGYGSS
jgi:hypothetical protein